MKALELLKEKLKLQNQYKGVSGMKPFIKETEEAIKELEELENRNCSNCKNKIFTEGGYYCNLPYHNIYIELDFYCNKWQSKK